MKLKVLLSLMLVAGIATMTYAKSHFITPGARAGGYGTAFVAVADDLTAIYYNPAGLAYQKDTQVMASIFYIDYPVTASDKALTNYGSDKYSTNAAVPFVAFSTKFYYDTVISAGIYVLGGGGGKVENPVSPYFEKIEGQQSYMVYNISLAKQLTDKFSIGLGFDAIQFQDKLVAKGSYVDMKVPGGIDYNRSAFGFQGNIGLMYKPVEKLSTAFVLRSGSYVDVPNEQCSSNPAFKENVCYPLVWEFGFAYDLFEDFTFDDFEVVLEGGILVGNRLCLNALRGIHDQQSAFAGRDAARHFVGKVDVAGSIDKVERIGLPLVVVFHLDGVALDGDATLALKVHVVEHLVDEFLVVKRVGQFQEAVGQGRFAVVDMSDDAEISDVFHYGRKSTVFSHKYKKGAPEKFGCTFTKVCLVK